MFEQVKPEVNPKKIMFHFKFGILTTLNEVFPNAEVKGCLFVQHNACGPIYNLSAIQVETTSKQCHKCVTTEDVVHTKIQETNKLIENLQKTLDEIRHRTKSSQITEENEIVGSKTEEAVDIIEKTEDEAGRIETEHVSDGENNAASATDVTEASSSETENPPPQQQAPNTTPEDPHAEGEVVTVDELKISDEHQASEDDAITIDLFRPKTRRTCGCRKKAVELSDKFRTAPEVETNGMDDFEVLQAKLASIVESADSDDSKSSEGNEVIPPEEKNAGPRVSFAGSADWLFRDFVSTGPSLGTQSVSTAMQRVSMANGSSQTDKTLQPTLVQKNTNNFEISPKKTQLELSVQMLPPLSIRREPVAQNLVNFFIDPQGRTFVTFKNKSCNVGFIEIQSSSLTKVYSADYSEILSTKSKIQEKKTKGPGWTLFNEPNIEYSDIFLQKRSQENKPSRKWGQRSFSDTELLSSKGGRFTRSSTDSQQHNERRKVLQSYQLLDENTRHDPGVLSALSLDVISTIDENVYKTYINPKGFALPPMSTSTFSAHKPQTKTATLEKLSSQKLLNKVSGSADNLEYRHRRKVLQSFQLLDNQKRHDPSVLSILSLDIIGAIDENVYKTYINPQGFAHKPKTVTLGKLSSTESLNKTSDTDFRRLKTESEKSSQASKTNNDKIESSGAPKLYNIGLYKSRSTQIVPVERRREIKERKALAVEDEEKRSRGEKEKYEEREKRQEDELALRHQKEENAKKEGHKEKYTSRESEQKDTGEIEEREEQESEEELNVGKRTQPLDEIGLKRQKDKEYNAKRGERKEKDKSWRREQDDNRKREDNESVVSASIASSIRGECKVARSSMSYERISLSISYSTEESIITEPSSEVVQTMSEDQQYDRQRAKSGSYRRSKGSQTFKNLKQKITKEHAFEQMSDTKMSSVEDEDETSYIAVPNFISGLLNTSTASIKKVIPHIRRSVREAKSDMRTSVLFSGSGVAKLAKMDEEETQRGSIETQSPKSVIPPGKKTRKSAQAADAKTSKWSSSLMNRGSFDDSHEEKELRNHNFHVSPVHVHGDSLPVHRRMVKPPEYVPIPLRVGKNGRYKDEENMFCESNSPQFENSLHRRFRAIPESLYKTKFAMDSSNSDTVTNAERASSEGEVRCECSVSIGEIHACRKRHSPSRLRRQSPFSTGEHSAGIRKRRTYFNNWVTYYVNKNAMSVNDSSSTS